MDEPFVMVPVRLLTDERLTSVAVHVYGLIFRWERKSKQPWPGRKRLAEEVGCSFDTIDRALRLLESTGWITVEERPGKPHLYHRGDGRVAAPVRPSRARASQKAAARRGTDSRTGAAPIAARMRPPIAAPVRPEVDLESSRSRVDRSLSTRATAPQVRREGERPTGGGKEQGRKDGATEATP
jgi:DNA-binding transcriptional MocR family regulator